MIVVYDFGSNNGDDLPYYLKKSDLVVAVEANPILVEQIKLRFHREIEIGKLIVEGCVLTADESKENVPFYIHKYEHVLSQFPEPPASEAENFEKVLLPSKRASEIVKRFGIPYYVKIDIEHYDQKILENLFQENIRPDYISSESHDISIFSTLVTLGGYDSFKLVDGFTVNQQFKDHKIKTDTGEEIYSFPFHSAGPFGEDIPGSWVSANDFFYLLADAKLGWKDIHATKTNVVNGTYDNGPKNSSLDKQIGSLPSSIIRAIKNVF